jgi:hypothetical protein
MWMRVIRKFCHSYGDALWRKLRLKGVAELKGSGYQIITGKGSQNAKTPVYE